MRRLYVFILALVIVAPSTLFSQSREIAYDQILELQREKFMRSSADPYDSVEGTPYYYDDFRDGVVYLHNGSKIEGKYRFDAYKNQFQYQDEKEVFVFAYPDSIARIDIGTTVFRYLTYFDDPMMKSSYFIEVVGGYCNLYKKLNKVFYEAIQARPYQDPVPPTIRDEKVSYFFSFGGEHPKKIGTKKEFLQIAGEFSLEIEKFMKENKTNLKKEFDLVVLFNYINSLYSQ